MKTVWNSIHAVFFPEGSEGRGFCIGRVYSDKKTPENPGLQFTRISFHDAFIKHDRDNKTLTIDYDGETIVLRAKKIIGEAEVLAKDNDILVENGDVIADGVSLKHHEHG